MAGRPPEYKPEFCQKLIDHMREGDSFETFGAIVGKSKRTLYNWTEQYAEFQEAKEKGEVLSEHWWWKKGKEYMVTFDKETKFNVAVWIFTMKCRFGLRDGSEGGRPEKQPDDTPPTDAEIRAIVDLATARQKRKGA